MSENPSRLGTFKEMHYQVVIESHPGLTTTDCWQLTTGYWFFSGRTLGATVEDTTTSSSHDMRYLVKPPVGKGTGHLGG